MAEGNNEISINHLPDNVLTQIFSLLNAEEVFSTINRTCTRWNEITQLDTFRRGLTYTPYSYRCNCEVVKFIRNVPEIQRFIFRSTYNYRKIIATICKYCKNVKSILIRNKHHIHFCLVLRILDTFPRIEALECYNGLLNMSPNYAREECEIYKSYRYIQLRDIATNAIDAISGNRDIKILVMVRGISTEFFSSVCKLKDLEYLRLQGYCKENQTFTPNELTQLRRLQTLQLSLFPDHRPEGIADQFDNNLHFRYLIKLEIVEGGRVLESCLNSILQLCPKLKHLNIQNNLLVCSDITNVRHCTDLEYLDVSRNYEMSDELMAILSESCSKLKFLDITECVNITDNFIIILQGCRQLETIILEGKYFSGKYFEMLSVLYPNLSYIDLRHLRNTNLLRRLRILTPYMTINCCKNDDDECVLHRN